VAAFRTDTHVDRAESPFARRRAALGAAADARPAQPAATPAATGSTATGAALDAAAASDAPAPDTRGARRVKVRAARRWAGLRPMTGYEEQLVEARKADGNMSALCNEVLARCVNPPGVESRESLVDVGRLSVAERDWALIELRRLTFGDRLESEADCSHCGETNQVSFDLKQLTFDVGEIAEEIEVTLADGRLARLAPPTARDQADLLDARLASEAERRTWLLARALRKLGDVEGPFDFAAAHALDSGTRTTLEKELERAIPDLDLSMDLTCLACSRSFLAPFDVAVFFLLS
jgi:hypothetical protein